ncbi:transporter substrate-binding domain-containing protein [Pelomonas sp. SE-A7]|uniref:substrate-binding periplasmic protein n=1 Tax=Pelomonas sp. SE-A7 TaxID=3054953 RepID=UPI00259CF94D|nr:transporter substrate-binding domain-containing protein [Pelomonas sp. SE-A7]MDM4766866.1 transporter substrate-binding domain-containing protein [Pelomonas sp. SE-A7]
MSYRLLFSLFVAALPMMGADLHAQVLRTVQQSNSLAKYSPQDKARPGICMEILRAVEQQDPGLRFSGLDQQVPLRRVELMLGQGEVDVFFCLLRSAQREKQWRYLPVPLYRIQHVVAMRHGPGPEPRELSDLVAASRRKPVVVTRGTVLAASLLEAGVQLAEAASDHEALQMLMLGRTDMVYGQDLNLLRNIRESGLQDKVRVASTVFNAENQYLAVANQVPVETEQRLLLALTKLYGDGRLKAISERYR